MAFDQEYTADEIRQDLLGFLPEDFRVDHDTVEVIPVECEYILHHLHNL